jgi:signal recognition particle GTPase
VKLRKETINFLNDSLRKHNFQTTTISVDMTQDYEKIEEQLKSADIPKEILDDMLKQIKKEKEEMEKRG